MRRREFFGVLGGVAAGCWPQTPHAQTSGKPARIGVFVGSLNPVMAPAYAAFLDELRKLGFSEGQNLIIDLRETGQTPSALAAQAADMARANVEVIVALGSEAPLKAAIEASRSIPVVFVANNFDPIALGYVRSLSKPGGNATGIVLRQTELAEKQVELLAEAFPGKTRLAVLWDTFSAHQFAAAERRAQLLHLTAHSLKLEKPPYDFDEAFRTVMAASPQMLLVLSSPFFGLQRERIVDLAIRDRLPAMFIFKSYAEAGGLMSYGADNVAMYRQSAGHVAKILRGAKPVDLPIEQPTRFEFVVNLKTAKAIGIELPTSILLRATEVIE